MPRNVGNILIARGNRKFWARRCVVLSRRTRCSRGYPLALRVCAVHSRCYSILVFRGVLRVPSELRGLRDRHRAPPRRFSLEKEAPSNPRIAKVFRNYGTSAARRLKLTLLFSGRTIGANVIQSVSHSDARMYLKIIYSGNVNFSRTKWRCSDRKKTKKFKNFIYCIILLRIYFCMCGCKIYSMIFLYLFANHRSIYDSRSIFKYWKGCIT